MYQLQEHPDAIAMLQNDETFVPIATLADEYGGRAQIMIDDHCHVLCLRQEDGKYKHTAWWFKEAVAALLGLMDEKYARLQKFADMLILG